MNRLQWQRFCYGKRLESSDDGTGKCCKVFSSAKCSDVTYVFFSNLSYSIIIRTFLACSNIAAIVLSKFMFYFC